MMKSGSTVYVAGGDSFIGAALVRRLSLQTDLHISNHLRSEPDLTQPGEVLGYMSQTRPDYVFCVAGPSGGIHANQLFPADLMHNNLLISCNVIHAAFSAGVSKLLFLASSCSYPKVCSQPMREEYVMTGALEPTNEAYATAKIAGMVLAKAYRQQYGVNYISAIPANPFGPGDDFHLENSHVISALLRKMHEAKLQHSPSVEIWGTGLPQREFIYVDDLADALVFLMNNYSETEPVNAGTGFSLSIRELAGMIQSVTGYEGTLYFNNSKPDGMPVKILNSEKILQMGWKPKVANLAALKATYQYYLQEVLHLS